MMHIFYKPGYHENHIHLDPSESHHCINVLRVKHNDEVAVINGHGTYYNTRVLRPDPRKVELTIISFIEDYDKRSYHLHVAIAPTKNLDRFEWFLEKATEIGVDEITPIFCHHSNRIKLRSERFEKVIISAVKQSQKATLPILNQPVSFNDFIKKEFDANLFIAYCSDNYKEHLLTAEKSTKRNIVLIGPEGDFSDEEIKSSINAGYTPVSLGNSRLRTETAAIVAVQIIADNYVIKDFQ